MKQFLWLASGGALLFILFITLNKLVFIMAAIPIGGVSVALAFVKINETPLMNYVIYGITYLLNPKQYIFKKEEEKELQEFIVSEGNNK